MATHYTDRAVPKFFKKKHGELAHVAPPLFGLSLATQFNEGNKDEPTATILTNFTVEDDRIKVRAGFKKRATRGTAPVWCLLPFYSDINALLAASNNELWDAQNGNLVKSGFTSNDWHWTAFSNLSQQDYTVMVNGLDGVWSWNGAMAAGADQPAVNVTNLSNANPAVITVAAADVNKLQNGMTVTIAGATGTGMTAANGSRVLQQVETPANSFILVGVNTSAGSGPQTSGVTADPPGLAPIYKEMVNAPSTETWVDPDKFHIVLAHMNRLWFADEKNLAVYYLPLRQKSGTVKVLPLNALFKRGGSIRAMYTWTMDGGENVTDQLVIFTSNGECAIYGGTDPDSDFGLSGVFRFDAPMSKHSVINYGGDLYVMISTGVMPLSQLIKAETEFLGNFDRSVVSVFLSDAVNFRSSKGWALFLNPSTGRLICNIPQGATNRYKQMIRHMPKAVWSDWQDIPSRCYGWIDPFVYFGDDKGNVYEMHPMHLNDDGNPINVVVQSYWSQFGTPARKHFLAIQTYMISNGQPRPSIDLKVDYDSSPGINIPDITELVGSSLWDVAHWNTAMWSPGEKAMKVWNGVPSSGISGSVRVSASIYNCAFAITGWDVLFETGKFGP
jgi:hypothetical protein